MMISFQYKYQNALRQATVFGTFSFVKNRLCVTQICITKIAAKMHSGSCSQMTPSCKFISLVNYQPCRVVISNYG